MTLFSIQILYSLSCVQLFIQGYNLLFLMNIFITNKYVDTIHIKMPINIFDENIH